MTLPIERTARARNQDGTLSEARVFDDFKHLRAWVLLGDPGSGKTTTFEALAKQEGGEYVKASYFLDITPIDGYRTPLFIDGLDEATALEGQSSLGRIRSKLHALDTPKFRISCREADWRGSTDSNALQQLVGTDQFAELHLAPLNSEQILKFAAYRLKTSEADAQAFVDQAYRRDLDGLLTNPQTLRMLIDAVGSKPDEWPDSKAETYRRACAKLVREQNEEHLAALRDTSQTDAQLLNAASYLCAVMLLSGSGTIAMQQRQEPSPHVLELSTLIVDSSETPSLSACRTVLRTHLFVGDGMGDFTPVHRTVTEYLGATYLAERVRAHLPANRIFALIQGEDGGVVPELRGLHAWLAVVTNDSVRRNLIEHDPLGLVLHGDVRAFSVAEKLHILSALQREAQRYVHFRSQNWASHPFGALATEDMQSTFRTWLQSTNRTPAHQAVLDCVLDSMEHGQVMLELADDLDRIVRDTSYRSEIRQNSLTVLCAYGEKNCEWTATQRLLDAVREGKVEDSDDVLLGTLLQHLYPSVITPKEIWGYYKPSFLTSDSSQWVFWHYLGTRNTPRESLPALLDALLATSIRLRSNGDDYFLSELIGDLLIETLCHFGGHSEVARVYAWLTLGMGAYRDNGLTQEKRLALSQWLTDHPTLYKALVEHGISLHEHRDEPEHLWLYEIRNTLCEAEPPSDAVSWYLTLAEGRKGRIRQQLIAEAFQLTERRAGGNAKLESMELWAHQHPEDSEWITKEWLSCPYPPEEEHIGWITRGAELKRKEAQKHAQELEFLREELPKLFSANPHQGLLIHIGKHYLRDATQTSNRFLSSELHTYLNNDPQWIEIALAGLRQCLDKVDIPESSAIFNSNLKSKYFPISHACLAAIHLRYAEAPDSALALPPSLLKKLIALWLTSHYGNTPAWFAGLLQEQPDLVAPVVQQFMAMQIAAKVEHVHSLYALAHDLKYTKIAQQIASALVETLPIRAAKVQLRSVRELIVCLLRTLARPQQLALIDKKLATPGMDVAQRVYWFVAGVQVAPALYLEALKGYLGSNQSRAAHAYDLLREQRQERESTVLLTLEAKAFFIHLLGARFTPSEEPKTGEAYIVTPAMESMRFVQQLIASIAADPSDEASLTLEQLEKSSQLIPWNSALQHAVYEQNILRRKVRFKHASVNQVCQTLSNLQPANAADLHALVVDHLNQLAHEIRHGNTNDYGQYWSDDKPKIENDCRDALLSDLKKHLHPLQVNAEPEGNYADHKRADIKVLYATHQVPIEIKRDSHKDLWKAIHEQLIAKYSREHSSDGYGVYIVFWFNHAPMPVAGDGGNKPKTPQELQQRLAATIPNELKHKISVLVIDCAKPLRSK
nr:hypothetical protein [uncultured Rhodoferax sp.]